MASSGPRFCPRCGAQAGDMAFCPNCGLDLRGCRGTRPLPVDLRSRPGRASATHRPPRVIGRQNPGPLAMAANGSAKARSWGACSCPDSSSCCCFSRAPGSSAGVRSAAAATMDRSPAARRRPLRPPRRSCRPYCAPSFSLPPGFTAPPVGLDPEPGRWLGRRREERHGHRYGTTRPAYPAGHQPRVRPSRDRGRDRPLGHRGRARGGPERPQVPDRRRPSTQSIRVIYVPPVS